VHQITAIFEDGKLVRFPAKPDEIVYQAAYRSSIRLEHDCLEGACGACKALCTQGDFTVDDYVDEVLSDAERAAGYTLLCKTKAKSSCTIELPYSSSFLAGQHEAQWLDASVVAVEPVSSSVIRMVLQLPDGAVEFLPGQYIHMEVPGGAGAVRSYSFANAPAQAQLEFFLKVYPQGAMSDYLRARARAGDAIRIKGPAGHFYLRAPRRPILMIAGGSGLAPMLSMLRSMEQSGAAEQPVHLIYGVNDASEFFGASELEQLATTLRLTVELVAVSPAGWDGPAGHVTSVLRKELLGGGDCDAYLCGPPPMIEAASAWLRANGMDPARVHAERFVTSS
jgi:NAD(P)H-flavin reductase/ferredoxin